MPTKLLIDLHTPGLLLPKKDQEFQKLIEEIENFSIASQVFTLLRSQNRLEQTPSFFQARLKKLYNESLYQNLYIKNQTKDLFTFFESKGVAVVPLKGVYFAERFYGHIGARVTSDIDILVKKIDVEAAIECVKGMGFLQEGELIPNHFHISFSKRIPGSSIPLTVELHWDVVKAKTAKLDIAEFWERATPFEEYTYVKQLSDYHTFYMICLHGWRHNLDSPKYYLDIIQMIHTLKGKIDYHTLLEEAKSHQTYKRVVRTLSIVYQQFPFLNEIVKFQGQQVKRYPTIFTRSSTSKMGVYLDFMDYQFFSYDCVSHTFSEMYEWLVPNERDISAVLKRRVNKDSYKLNFLLLYKHRILSMVKKLFVKTRYK